MPEGRPGRGCRLDAARSASLAVWLEHPALCRVGASAAAFCAAWMVTLATRYFAVSAVPIDAALRIGRGEASWLSAAYLAGEPLGVMLGCWLALALSVRRVLLAGIVLFLAASLGFALLPYFAVTVAARGSMGLAAGAIIPLAILTQLRAYSLTWRPLAIALYASASTMGPQIAAGIAFWVLARQGWPVLICASLVPGIAALLLGHWALPREKMRWRPLLRADLLGIATLGPCLALLAAALSEAGRLGWHAPVILALLAAASGIFALFLLHERRAIRHPVILLRLAQRRNFFLGLAGTLPLQLGAALSGLLVPGALAQLEGWQPARIAAMLRRRLLAAIFCLSRLRHGVAL